MTTGWECPVCHSVWAPSVLRCQNTHGGQQGTPVPVNPHWPRMGPSGIAGPQLNPVATGQTTSTSTASYTVNGSRQPDRIQWILPSSETVARLQALQDEAAS